MTTHQESDAVPTEVKVVTQKDQTATEESKAISQEEQLASLEQEVANIRSKIKDCTQGMQESQNTLAKVTRLCFMVVLTLYQLCQ